MAKIKKREISTKRLKSHTHRALPKYNRLSFINTTTSHIVLGAAAGCALGAAAAFLFPTTPKRHTFTKKLDEIYDSITEAADEYSHGALEKGQKFYETARDTAGDIYSSAAEAFSGKNSNRNLVLGILCAGVLGASAIYALNQRATHNHDGFIHKWGLKKWPEMAKLVVNAVSEKLQEGEEHAESHNPIQNAIDWATAGFNLWQEIKKRS